MNTSEDFSTIDLSGRWLILFGKKKEKKQKRTVWLHARWRKSILSACLLLAASSSPERVMYGACAHLSTRWAQEASIKVRRERIVGWAQVEVRNPR